MQFFLLLFASISLVNKCAKERKLHPRIVQSEVEKKILLHVAFEKLTVDHSPISHLTIIIKQPFVPVYPCHHLPDDKNIAAEKKFKRHNKLQFVTLQNFFNSSFFQCSVLWLQQHPENRTDGNLL